MLPQTAEPQRTLGEVTREVDEAISATRELGRRTAASAWRLGGLLSEARGLCPHGEWLPWLEGRGITREWARKLQTVHEKVPLGDISPEDTIKRLIGEPEPELPTPEPEPEPAVIDDFSNPVPSKVAVVEEPPPKPARLTAQQVEKLQAALWQRQRDIAALREENATLRDRVEFVEGEQRPAAAREILFNSLREREKVALRARDEWMAKHAELARENKRLRRWLRKLGQDVRLSA